MQEPPIHPPFIHRTSITVNDCRTLNTKETNLYMTTQTKINIDASTRRCMKKANKVRPSVIFVSMPSSSSGCVVNSHKFSNSPSLLEPLPHVAARNRTREKGLLHHTHTHSHLCSITPTRLFKYKIYISNVMTS